MPIPIYTPAQVIVAPRTENHVRVVGGQVWDFSRFALATPVVVVRGTSAGGQAHEACRCFKVVFKADSTALSQAMKWRLLELPRDRRIWVAAGSSALAQMRAQEVGAFLSSHGRVSASRKLYSAGAGNDVLVMADSR